MIEKQDYRKYLSVDNGKGLLLSGDDTFVLEHYDIDYKKYSNVSDLIFTIGSYIDDHQYNEELDDLEEVLDHLMEMHYYYETKK